VASDMWAQNKKMPSVVLVILVVVAAAAVVVVRYAVIN